MCKGTCTFFAAEVSRLVKFVSKIVSQFMRKDFFLSRKNLIFVINNKHKHHETD